MSYNVDGKIVNQPIRKKIDGQVICEKCFAVIKAPSKVVMRISSQKEIFINHYIGSDSYVYETKKGYAIMYCSNKCRKKHNHRY